MSDNSIGGQDFSTAPKPYVFVLMPFHEDFRDTYRFGIRGAAEDVGAYAERVDDQIFETGILDRIYNQINKADVVVADLTGRNPNVFYEVGYAHALGKIVLLVARSADDVPFDLKHHQHTIYRGKIEDLRAQLVPRLRWAIDESKRRGLAVDEGSILVSCQGLLLPEISSSWDAPVTLRGETQHDRSTALTLTIRNGSSRPSEPISYLYLLTKADPEIEPATQKVTSPQHGIFRRHAVSRRLDSGDPEFPFQYRLDQQIAALPPGAVEEIQIFFVLTTDDAHGLFSPLQLMQPKEESGSDVVTFRSEFRLRLHETHRMREFGFNVEIKRKLVEKQDGKRKIVFHDD